MQFKLLNAGPLRTFALVDTGEEAVDCLTRFAREQSLHATQLSAIGAFSRVTLGYFDFARKDYLRIEIDEQVELVSLLGDFALSKGEPKLHAHVVVAKSDGTAHGGHLLEGIVRPTLEVVLNESPAWLHREVDRATGLPLIRVREPA
ncbi:MAG TPA: PPC domain-containing DNA-binding protein [Casimicrobiaceae bacterium]|nr:PPC domain-containing DNA-binding protein [Casimicrobiaceae bacterium]